MAPASSASPETRVLVRHCQGLDEFRACLRLEKRVWGGDDIDVVPLALFVVTAATGGQVLGAFAEAEMVGFTLALAALREGRTFLHSHMTAVVPEHQDRGIGRQLKLFQRQDALARGIDLVEWTFDPIELKNAYFNLERLGAVVRRFIPNCYGVTTSPLHAGMPTDRMVAEWWLRSRRVEETLAGGHRGEGKHIVRIPVPRNIAELKKDDLDRVARMQREVSAQFQDWLGRNYVVTGLELTAEVGNYLLEPSDAIGEVIG